MANITPTENLYRQLLESLDVEIKGDDSGLFYAYEEDGKPGPINIDGKHLVLPTRANLKELPKFWEDKIAFHPITEQALREESKVFRIIQSLINWKVIGTLSYISHNMAIIAAHPEISKELNPKQHVLLDALVDANKKTVKYIKDITSTSFLGDPNKRLVRTHIKRGGKYLDKKYSAVLITLFSLFENGNIDNDKRTIFGIKAPRKSDFDAAIDLFKLIFPKSDIVGGEYYNVGSNDKTAPRLHALLLGYMNIALRLNDVIKTYGNLIEGHEDNFIKLNWTDSIDNFDKIRHDIPPLEDNYGEVSSDTEEESETSKKLSKGVIVNELGHSDRKYSSDYKQSNLQRDKASNNTVNNTNTDTQGKKKMSMNPMMMMQLLGQNNNDGNSFNPMSLLASGCDIDPSMMMMMNQQSGGTMDKNTLMMMAMSGGIDSSMLPFLMNDGDMDMEQIMLMQAMGKDGDSSSMLPLLMMNKDKGKGKDGGIDMEKMMMMQAMGGGDMSKMLPLLMMNKDNGGEIDPMMMMAMGGGDMSKMLPLLMMNKEKGGEMDPMMMMMAMGGGDMSKMLPLLMMQNQKAEKGKTTTPKQPSPKTNSPEYPS